MTRSGETSLAGTRGLFALGLSCAVVLLFANATRPAEPSDPVVLAAGDIADCNATGDSATAELLDAHPGTVLSLGDHAYENGTAQEFAACYEPTWGRHRARTLPTPGNHEYHTPGAAGYFGYFGGAAGPGDRGYYSVDLGSWHVISLNSERDTGLQGAQVAWLRADLAATNADCVLAYWHQPRWTSGNYADLSAVEHLWNVLYDAGADVVLAAHDHNYQRYPRMSSTGAVDHARGIRSFVVGTGGRHRYALRPDARREAGTDDSWGVLELTLHPGSYSWRFLGVAGSTYTDSGSDTCSSSAPPPSPPPLPTPPPPPTDPPPTPPPSPLPPPSPTPTPQASPVPPALPAPSSSPPGSPSPHPAGADAASSPTPSPPSPPPSARPGNAEPPALKIGRGPVRISASGRGRIWLACPNGGSNCEGRITIRRKANWRSLAAPRRRARMMVGAGSFNLRAGSARPVRVEMTRQGLRILMRRGGIRGRLVAASTDARPAASRPVRLVLVKAKRN
jgi:hypothetical protein